MHANYLVIGGGLAGSVCAYLLNKAGQDVIVLERQNAASKNKLCGGMLTTRSLEMLEKIYGPNDMPAFEQTMSSMICITENHTVPVHNIVLKTLQRKDLDAFALQHYLDEGGVLFDSCSVTDIDFEQKTVFARKRPDNEQLTFSYDVLIAADGALSTTRKLICGHKPPAVLSLEAEVAPSGKPITVLYNQQLHGYAWYIPAGETAKIGCCSFTGCNLKPQLGSFARLMGVELEEFRGAYIPTGKELVLREGSTYFLGDAAGLICPPTGEGIYYALKSAYALCNALLSNASYTAMMKSDLDTVKRQYKMRDLFFNKRFMDMGLAAAEHTPYGTERAVKFALKHFCSF